MFEGPASASDRLATVLLKTFGAIALGYICIRWKWIDPAKGEMKAIGFYVGKIAFPLLFFKTVATADINGIVWPVIIACNASKLVAYMLAFFVGYFLVGGKDRLSTATIFGFFAIASNDFAVGFPVIDALYPPSDDTPDLSVYLAVNSLFVTVFFIPMTLVLLSIGKSQSSGQEFNRQAALGIAKTIATNPVIIMTCVGFAFKVYPGTTDGELPSPLKDVVELATQPFTMLALFLTGASLKTLSFARWPVALVLLKVIFCSFAGAFLCSAIRGQPLQTAMGHDVLVNFSFLYGSIPTSSAPLVFAAEFAPGISELVASAIILGLLTAGPVMYMSSILFAVEMANLRNQLITACAVCVVLGQPCVIILTLLILSGARTWFMKAPFDLWVANVVAVSAYLFSKINTLYTCDELRTSPQPNQLFLNNSTVMIFSICQNLCRCMVMVVVVWKIRGFPQQGTKRAMLLAVMVACALGAVTPPNTLLERCEIPEEEWGISVWRTNIVVYTYLVALLLLFGYRLRTKQAEMEADEAREALEREYSTAQGCLVMGLTPPIGPIKMHSSASALGIFLLLRLFMSAVLGTAVGLKLGVRSTASFNQMIILEHILEHVQPLLVLVIIFSNKDFRPIIRRLFLYEFRSKGSRHRSSSGVSMVTMVTVPDNLGKSWDVPSSDVLMAFEAVRGQAVAFARPRKVCCWDYNACVTGEEIVTLIAQELSLGRKEAALTGIEFMRCGLITQIFGWGVFYDSPKYISWFYLDKSEEHSATKNLRRVETVMWDATGIVTPELPRFGEAQDEDEISMKTVTSMPGTTERLQPLMGAQPRQKSRTSFDVES